MTRSVGEHSSNDATAPVENPKFSLVERLDQLQWQLDDIDMRDVDRFEIDYFMGTLLKDVMARAAGKKKRWMVLMFFNSKLTEGFISS